MADQRHLTTLKQGVDIWNQWREEYPGIHPDLSEADLTAAHLNGINLRQVNLEKADLRETHLEGADLSMASLVKAHLEGANLSKAKLDTMPLVDSSALPVLSLQPLFVEKDGGK